MSIYALPGPLFELISSGISIKASKADAEEACAAKDKSATRCLGSSSSEAKSLKTNNPLHRQLSSGSSLDDNSEHSQASIGGARNGSNVVIAVKEAKIDPERLIRSLTQKSDSRKSLPSLKPSDQQNDNSPKHNNTTSGTCQRDCCRPCDPHEDAIKFEISVSFNGREYTATRTLPRILQFRYDLIEEFQTRRKMRARRRRKESEVPRMAAVKDLSDDEEEDDTIPELPRLSEDAAGGRGFTMLNALLRPYGPALERWLLKVIDLVPHDSQCLAQFLWEPISGSATSHTYDRRKSYGRRSSSNLSTLGAIHESQESDDAEQCDSESDDAEQYDSDTDDFIIHH